MDGYLGTGAVADLFGVSPKTVQTWIVKGYLSPKRVGLGPRKRYLISKDQVVKLYAVYNGDDEVKEDQ